MLGATLFLFGGNGGVGMKSCFPHFVLCSLYAIFVLNSLA